MSDLSKCKIQKIAIVVGEKSGDALGAILLEAIRNKYPNAYCYGIGGSKMKKYGFHSIAPLEMLSVMGIVEVLGSIISLVKLRRKLTKQFIDDKPDIFIGIDAPDFNLGLEKQLRKAGIKCVHYVSPQIWAWREYRLKGFKKSMDHVLTLFPFEVDYYTKHGIAATFVGHPYATEVNLMPKQEEARKILGISGNNRIIAILPGSRSREINKLARLFLETANRLQQNFQDLTFVMPAANSSLKAKITNILADYQDLDIILIEGKAELALAASTAVLIASGTATLEAALHQKPMVVSYKLNTLSYLIIKALIKIPYVALPNILAKKFIVPELLQHDATVDNLYQAMHKILTDKEHYHSIKQQLSVIYQSLQQESKNLAFDVLDKYLQVPHR